MRDLLAHAVFLPSLQSNLRVVALLYRFHRVLRCRLRIVPLRQPEVRRRQQDLVRAVREIVSLAAQRNVHIQAPISGLIGLVDTRRVVAFF